MEAALRVLEAIGWTVEKAKGRSTHAWGFAHGPANARDARRPGLFCRMSMWNAQRNPRAHARELARKADGCAMIGNEGDAG